MESSEVEVLDRIRDRTGTAAESLRPYDIRRDADRGRRRYLKLYLRRVLRRGSLYLLDGAVVAVTLLLLMPFLSVGPLDAGLSTVMAVGVFWVSLTLAGTYRAGVARHDYVRLAGGALLGGLALWLMARQAAYPGIGAMEMGLFIGILYPLLCVERWGVERLVLALRRRGYLLRRTLILGDASETWELIRRTREDPDCDLLVVGHLVPEGGSDPTALGGFEELEGLIEEHDVELVAVTHCEQRDHPDRVVERCLNSGVPVICFTALGRQFPCRVNASYSLGSMVLELHPPVLGLPQLTIKRAFDILFAAAALVLLSPVFLVIAALVKLESPGPVFFRQTRLGVGGKPFRIFKFRSMRADAEEWKEELEHLNQYSDGRLFKVKDDPRVTRIGALLRRTSLDELPQLINVLLGHMSMVGPRPPVPEEVATYEGHHFWRLTVLPGVTGPWQVKGRNNVTDFEEVVRMEREYIRNWSLRLDLDILIRTVGVVFRGEGAH